MVTENSHVGHKKGKKRKACLMYSSRKRVKHTPMLTTASTECCFCKDGDNQDLGMFFSAKMENIAAHQFCLLFSAGLPQLGEDEDGFDGFLLPDVFKEANRAHKIYCKICGKPGANSGCSVKSCRNLYHFKCGLKNGMQFIYAGAFDSYCKQHRSYQDMSLLRKTNVQPTCPVCLEKITSRNMESILKTPCCKNVFMHRSCIQRQANTSGYFFRCPTCNNEQAFTYEMAKYGIYVPNRDAEWEESGAFSELLEQYTLCDYIKCKSRRGRKYHKKSGKWNLLKCYGCGQSGIHVLCLGNRYVPGFGYVCSVCKVVLCQATADIQTHQRSYQERWRQHKMLLQKLKARDDPVLLASSVFGGKIWRKRFGINPCTVVVEPLNINDFAEIRLDMNTKTILGVTTKPSPVKSIKSVNKRLSNIESNEKRCVKSSNLACVYSLRHSSLSSRQCDEKDLLKIVSYTDDTPLDSTTTTDNLSNDVATNDNDVKEDHSLSTSQEGNILHEHITVKSIKSENKRLSNVESNEKRCVKSSNLAFVYSLKHSSLSSRQCDEKDFLKIVSYTDDTTLDSTTTTDNLSNDVATNDNNVKEDHNLSTSQEGNILHEHVAGNKDENDGEDECLLSPSEFKTELGLVKSCEHINDSFSQLIVDKSSQVPLECKHQLDPDDTFYFIQALIDEHEDLFEKKPPVISDVSHSGEKKDLSLDVCSVESQDYVKVLPCASDKENKNSLSAILESEKSLDGDESSITLKTTVCENSNYTPITHKAVDLENFNSDELETDLNSSSVSDPSGKTPTRREGYMTRAQLKRLSSANASLTACFEGDGELLSTYPRYELFVPPRKYREKCMCQLNGHLLNRYYIRKNDWIETKLNWCIIHNVPIPVKMEPTWHL